MFQKISNILILKVGAAIQTACFGGTMPIIIRSTTKILSDITESSVDYAINSIKRDLTTVLTPSQTEGSSIRLIRKDMGTEAYRIYVRDGSLWIEAGDDLGFVYGLYAFSREILGVKDLWFWNDQHFTPVDSIPLSDTFHLESQTSAVRFRGVFINDEVLFEHWSVDNDPEQPWRMAFEAVCRLGGNLVIPGSGQRGEPHLDLARQMGLYVNQHHTCPLGSRMFSSAFPDLEPRWPEERKRFEFLWREAIRSQQGQKTLWTLGFRGQGDRPFWVSDPRYTSDESRGAVLTETINLQYQMVQEAEPGAPCVVYLYGEVMDLYRKHLLTLPNGVIKIWSDNGYGRMVSRRQNNNDPRVPSMPDGKGSNGIYFHVSFYDLQAANHITPLVNKTDRVINELDEVLRGGGDQVWIINVSNVKPHVFMLSLIASMWRQGMIDTKAETAHYLQQYYGCQDSSSLVRLLNDYQDIAVQYGPHWDQHAGDQYFNYVPRILITQYIKDSNLPTEELFWMTKGPTFKDQLEEFKSKIGPSVEPYHRLDQEVEREALSMELNGNKDGAELLRDSLGVATGVYRHCSKASLLVCQALETAMSLDYRRAFYLAGRAREEYLKGNQSMRSREHGKWQGFWANDCLTDVKQSALVCSSLMGYLRCMGDGPYFNDWKRDFTYPREEQKVFVITNMENHESDDQIFQAMKRTWQD